METRSRSVSERLKIVEGEGLQPDGLVDMVRSGDAVLGETELPEFGMIEFEATGIRRERTGLHARVLIRVGDALAAFNTFNVERDEDRTKLANSAAKRISASKAAQIKVRLDQFAFNLWPTWIESGDGMRIGPSLNGRPQWMLEPYILRDKGTILFAPGGSGKSWVGLLWAVGLEHGGLPWPHQPTRTLFVNLERDQASINWRLWCLGRVLETEHPTLLSLNRRGHTIWDAAPNIERMIKGEGVELVVIDSLSRAGIGNLRDDEAANRIMDTINGFGCAWCVLAHTSRADASHEFGSVMFANAADLTVQLTSVPSTESCLGVRLEVKKANDVRKAKPGVWAMDFDDEGLLDFRRALPGEFPDFETESPVTAIVDAIAGSNEGRASADDIAQIVGLTRSRVAQLLNSEPRFVRLGGTAKGGRGQRAMWGLAAPGGLVEPA